MDERSAAEVTLGPVLFNWTPDTWRDFYFRIADEAPVSTVYLGEVVCSKRAVLFESELEPVVARLKAAGKTVVFSTLSEVVLKLDRQQVESVCGLSGERIEINDASALYHLRGRPHHVGPYMNVYNEETLAVLAARGAQNVCLPPEVPACLIGAVCASAAPLRVSIEVQVFGRLPLALSARCYHARAHGRTKDSCLFVCEDDPDGMPLRTVDGRAFLSINGIQTMSHDYLNLVREVPALRALGVTRFRLSPHTCDMVAVAGAFRGILDGSTSIEEATARLDALDLPAPFSNGFFHGKPGYTWTSTSDASIVAPAL